GRTIYDDGMIEEGKYNKGFLTEGRRISNNGMIEEGKWNKGMMTEGRMISTDGKIYDGEYHTTGYLKKGTKTSPDGSKETAEWDEKNVKITQAAESAKPAEQQTPPAPPIVGPDAEPEIPPAPPIVGADAESAKPATTAETAPVAPVAPASAPSAPETRPSTRTTERFKADEKARMDKKATYIRDWEKISEENRNVSKTVSSLGENGIESNWKYIKGSGKVDKILKLQPFNISKHDTGRFIAKTITEWSNKEITLEDIFNIAAKHNPNFPRDYDKFMAEFKDLSNKNSAKENAEWARKFNEIVYPTIELLNAISKLNYNEKATKEAKEKREKENQSKEKVLSPEQKRIRENLYTMFTYSEREPGNWERLMGFFGGVKDEIPVMTDVNGETKYLDRGVLRRSYDPKAGYEIFMETIGTGEVDENDNRQIDADKMTDEVNRLMRLGGISIALQKLMLQEKKSIDELKKDPKFKEKLQKFHVPKLGSIQNFVQIPKDYMEAFQLGFILSQDMKSDKELEETKTMLESTENKEQSPVYKMMKDLEKQGLSQDVVAKIQDKLLAMGAVTFKDGKWEAAGLALNQPIQIGKGTTITVGISKIGKELKEGWNAGAALTVTVYEGENVKAGVSLEFDMNPLNKTFGFGFGANASFEDVLSTKLSFMGGVRAGRSGINVGFAALITRRNVGLRIAENKTEIEKETGLSSPEWEAFKASKGQSPKQRYELLKKATKIYDTIVVPLEATFGAEKEDVVYLIDNLENAIENKAVDKIGGDTALSIFAEFFHGVGAVVTPFPPMLMPVLVFKIGSAKIYIPNRSAISTMQEQISDVRANWKLKEALKSAEKKMEEGKPIATENQEAQGTTQTFKVGETPNLSYSPDGSARIIKKHQTFAFEENLRELDEPALGEEEGKAPKTSAEKLKALNDRLRKETGIMLVEDEKDSIDTDGRHELRILNTTNKDVEVYVDPRLSLKEAGLLVENGKLYLTGDISNLVIDRRNFTMPSGSQQSASYMKDIIIIGTQDLAAKEGLERDWIEKYSTQYAQKLKNQFGYSLEEGYGESAQANIKEGKLEEKEALALGAEAGERALKEATAEKEQVTRVKTHKENLVAKGERAKEAKAMDASAARRHESINSIEKKVYDAQKLPENFEEDIKELSKNKKFKDELKNISNDDEKIRDLILKFAGEKDKNGLPKYKGLQNLNEKALNLAIVSVLNEWFLALVKTGKESNSTIHKVLEGRMRFARKVFEKEFKTRIEEANKRLPEGEKISLTAEQAANKIMESIYNKIKDPNFPFKGLAWKVGEGVEGIPTDATLFSATRNKSLKGAFTKTMAYGKDTDTWAKMTLEHGFIKESVKEFNINSADKGEKDMARLLLEIASPSPKDKIETVADAKEFLQSPLAMKLSALEALMLIPEFGREKFDKVSELYKDISKENFATLFAKADYKEALDAYKKIAQDVRKAQTEGKPYTKEFDWGSDKYILTLSMTTAIKAGAYAKCANGSFYVKEEGTVTVQKIQKPIVTEKKVQEREPVTVFTQTTETIKSKQSKVLLTAALAGLNRETEQTTEQPPVHNKKAEQGAATATVTNKDRAGNANNGQIAQSKTTYDIPNENEGSVTSH
ncbi:hypothetical protein M0P48_04440, partial [Candidatus Gracilibacteria bacterium]|nr:hypothetical protein [Candidatus Gracilibacteria bacterium]